jgi:tetratricopeptide (TPR) repeat protein
VGLAALLGRALQGVNRERDRSTPAMLFRHADRCRIEGRYGEAARLVAEGLRQAPDSTVGHLISAYLHVAAHRADHARREFDRVLALDPYHPWALLGLARICIEDQDHKGAAALLDRALDYCPDFADARLLRETLGHVPRTQRSPGEAHGSAALGPAAPAEERDVFAMRTDGKLLVARTGEERGSQLAEHLMQVHRTVSFALSLAGLGSLKHAAIETGSCTTFILKDADLVFSATLDGVVDIGTGFARIELVRDDLGVKADDPS